jgi:putative phosphoribosyl transferase
VSSRHRFAHRRDAGRLLGERLSELRVQHPVVLGLARGGVPVAFEVARALDSPLDVLVVRKLGVPFHTELALGAIGEDDTEVLNAELIERLGISTGQVAAVIKRERAELARRVDLYQRDRTPLELAGRTAIIVDDGLATGATAHVAVNVARARGAKNVIVAVAVSPPETIAELERLDVEVISLLVPSEFQAVGEWYDDFTQTSDDDVTSLLRQSTVREPGRDTD